MKVTPTTIPDVLIREAKVFGDERGFCLESSNQRVFEQATGENYDLVQDNHSRSARSEPRCMRYQVHQAQGNSLWATSGVVFDVAVGLRKNSETFGYWAGAELSDDGFKQPWIPPGFAHGFVVLSESAHFPCATTDFYLPQYERRLAWGGIEWLAGLAPQLPAKNNAGTGLGEAEVIA